jgi:hypothetical protein
MHTKSPAVDIWTVLLISLAFGIWVLALLFYVLAVTA